LQLALAHDYVQQFFIHDRHSNEFEKTARGGPVSVNA